MSKVSKVYNRCSLSFIWIHFWRKKGDRSFEKRYVTTKLAVIRNGRYKKYYFKKDSLNLHAIEQMCARRKIMISDDLFTRHTRIRWILRHLNEPICFDVVRILKWLIIILNDSQPFLQQYAKMSHIWNWQQRKQCALFTRVDLSHRIDGRIPNWEKQVAWIPCPVQHEMKLNLTPL